MNDNQLLTRLAEANAYRENTPLPRTIWTRELALREIERRIGMEPTRSTTQTPSPGNTERPEASRGTSLPGRAFEAQRRDKTPRRLVVAAATAVIVMLVGLGTWALVGGDEDAAAEAEIDVVLSAIDAFNRGDFDAYRGWLTGVALSDENNSPRESDEMTFANRTTELAGCSVAGTAPTGEKIVECSSTSTDDFYSTGGIVDTQTATFTVTEDGRISTQDSVGIEGDLPWEETEFGMFNFAFWSWLMDAHPTVFDEIGPAPHNMSNIPGLDDSFGGDRHEPEEMLVALQYVDEFVAQSDVYPLSR